MATRVGARCLVPMGILVLERFRNWFSLEKELYLKLHTIEPGLVKRLRIA
jgi:hypothetical protein